jgi:hypothetical protein
MFGAKCGRCKSDISNGARKGAIGSGSGNVEALAADGAGAARRTGGALEQAASSANRTEKRRRRERRCDGSNGTMRLILQQRKNSAQARLHSTLADQRERFAQLLEANCHCGSESSALLSGCGRNDSNTTKKPWEAQRASVTILLEQ